MGMVNVMRPFSGTRYNDNADACTKDQWPCVCCGKPVPVTGHYMAEVLEGGARFASANEQVDVAGAGYMGCYPVGPNCAKKLRKQGAKLVPAA